MAFTNRWDDYTFSVWTIIEACKIKEAGVFIFAGKYIPLISTWTPYFIGETNDFQALKYHPLWIAAEKMGATHVHLHTLAIGEKVRKSRVEKLIKIYNPSLNKSEQFNKPTPLEATMSNDVQITEQLNETKSKLELLYQYEKHYLGLR